MLQVIEGIRVYSRVRWANLFSLLLLPININIIIIIMIVESLSSSKFLTNFFFFRYIDVKWNYLLCRSNRHGPKI